MATSIEDKDAIKYTISAALYSIGRDHQMLRSPLTSKTGHWDWEELPTGHTLVGSIKTGAKMDGRLRTYMSVFELNAAGEPIRWLCEDSYKKSVIDFHEDVVASPTERETRVKWRVKGNRFIRKARTSSRLVRHTHHHSAIPGSLEVHDRQEILAHAATPSSSFCA